MNKTMSIWNSLEKDSSFSSGLVMRRYSADIEPDVFVALLMPEKIKSIAFRLSNEDEFDLTAINKLKEVKVKVIEDTQFKDKRLIIISLIDLQFTEIFSVLCEDLILSVSEETDESRIFNKLFSRFEQWQNLFAKKRNEPLTSQEQSGLFGELWFLNRLIEKVKDPLLCIKLWQGPDYGIRDFELGSWALEVKTSTAKNHQKLLVSSERQLDNSHLDFLFLLHLSLEVRTRGKITLNYIIDSIRQKVSNSPYASTLLELNLIKAGYLKRDFDFYSKIGYEIRSYCFYQVFDNFPRIEEGDLRMNVGNVRYTIIPPQGKKYKTTFEKVVMALGGINEN